MIKGYLKKRADIFKNRKQFIRHLRLTIIGGMFLSCGMIALEKYTADGISKIFAEVFGVVSIIHGYEIFRTKNSMGILKQGFMALRQHIHDKKLDSKIVRFFIKFGKFKIDNK